VGWSDIWSKIVLGGDGRFMESGRLCRSLAGGIVLLLCMTRELLLEDIGTLCGRALIAFLLEPTMRLKCLHKSVVV
jgi:hypothetical protein